MSGEQYKVEDGDTVLSIAEAKGYRSWETIWFASENDALRDQREDPGVLAPGDSLFLPAKEPRDFVCETNQKHTFKVKSLAAYLELVLEDDDGEPYGNASFKAVIDDDVTIEGRTDADGYLKEKIAPAAKKAQLTVTPGDDRPVHEWTLNLGHLHPASTDPGIKALLNNLGYAAGDNDGELDDEFKAALMQFQLDHALEPTGELDEPTRAALAS